MPQKMHQLVMVRLLLSHISDGALENLKHNKGGAPENFQCTALLPLLQIQWCGGMTNHTVDYGPVSGGQCTDQTILLGVYILVAPTS